MNGAMQTAPLVMTCVLGMASFACLIAGLCALLSPDDADIKRIEEKLAQARLQGPLEEVRVARRESVRLSDIVSHWRSRPSVRSLFYVGLACFLLALFTGRFT
jgi:hypothetical protein